MTAMFYVFTFLTFALAVGLTIATVREPTDRSEALAAGAWACAILFGIEMIGVFNLAAAASGFQ